MRLSIIGIVLVTAASAAFGTNGNHFIGVSPAATALGGTGVANFTNVSDALYRNSALLTNTKAGALTGDLSLLLVDNNASANAGLGLKASSAKVKLSPTLAVGYGFNENLAFGLGVLTFGGATVDQVGQAELQQLQTRNSLLRLAPGVAYKVNDYLTVGVSPYLAYGSLALNVSEGGTQSARKPHGATGFGAQLGFALHPLEGLTLGLTYNTESNYTYESIIDLDAFGPTANPGLDNIEAQQPAELAAGLGYKVTEALTLTADYRFIQWNQAKAFQELGWQNQHVIAVGAQYGLTQSLKLRAGFNYAKSPIRDVTGEAGLTPTNFQGHQVFAQSLTNLNLIAFPAITESHVTVGGGYAVDESLNVDLGFFYAPKKTITRAGNGLTLAGTPGAYSLTAEASQWGLGAGATYRF